MSDAHTISKWYDALKKAEQMELELFRNTQSKEGCFVIQKRIKIAEYSSEVNEMYRSSDIALISAFLDGLVFNTL